MIEIQGIAINSVACSVPRTVANNIDFDGFDKERIEKIISATGVSEKRVVPKGDCTSDLCFDAALHIIQKQSINTEEIGVLLFISQTPDYRLPATACILQDRLGMNQDSLAFDINLGCSGYVYGLYLASLILQSIKKKYALLLVGDTSTVYCSEKDASTVFLFGDAGSATLLEQTNNAKNIYFDMGTDGSGWNNLIVPAGAFRLPSSSQTSIQKVDESGNIRSDENLYMDGMEIFNFAISTVVPHVRKAIEQHPDYSAVVFHQANKYMQEFMRKSLKIPKPKFHYSLHNYGNTSSASIPLTLCHQKDNIDLSKVLMTGFGVGYSWGTAITDMQNTALYEIIER